MQSQRIAYILLRFPYLTETFVAEEMQAVRSLGADLGIVSLLKPGPMPVHPLSEDLLPLTWYAPEPQMLALWKAQLHFLRRSPRLYLSLLATLLRQPYPSEPLVSLLKRFLIFLKAVAVADHLVGSDTQLLHAHFAWLSGAAAWIAARLLDLPFTVTVHAFDIYSHQNDLLRLVTGQADQVIAISEYNREQLAALHTCAEDRITVIHCGIDPTRLQVREQQPQGRSDDSPLQILSVGSLVAKKGHAYLIAACQSLRERGLTLRCTIIGSGPEEAALRQQAASLGLEDEVLLLGARSHPETIAAYAQSDLFVLASVVGRDGDRDGIPVVLMEAGMMGLPLISTQVSGIPELVRHGETGWLVRPGDSIALADAIAALAADLELRNRLGRSARALVGAEFSIKSNALRLGALFDSVRHQWEVGESSSQSIGHRGFKPER